MGKTKSRKTTKDQNATWLSEHPWMGIFILLIGYKSDQRATEIEFYVSITSPLELKD